MVNWSSMLTIFLAIVAASLMEHLVIAPRTKHSPPTIPFEESISRPRTIEELVQQTYPDAFTF
jgi:hypothetical protein